LDGRVAGADVAHCRLYWHSLCWSFLCDVSFRLINRRLESECVLTVRQLDTVRRTHGSSSSRIHTPSLLGCVYVALMDDDSLRAMNVLFSLDVSSRSDVRLDVTSLLVDTVTVNPCCILHRVSDVYFFL
jgi:hypothetical protein